MPSSSSSFSSSTSSKITTPTHHHPPLLYSDKHILHNSNVVDQCRSSCAMLLGVCAGILGLSSATGFLFFFFGSIVHSVLLVLLKLSSASSVTTTLSWFRSTHQQEYFQYPIKEVWTSGLTHGVFAYLLFWTMTNGVLRIYG